MYITGGMRLATGKNRTRRSETDYPNDFKVYPDSGAEIRPYDDFIKRRSKSFRRLLGLCGRASGIYTFAHAS